MMNAAVGATNHSELLKCIIAELPVKSYTTHNLEEKEIQRNVTMEMQIVAKELNESALYTANNVFSMILF